MQHRFCLMYNIRKILTLNFEMEGKSYVSEKIVRKISELRKFTHHILSVRIVKNIINISQSVPILDRKIEIPNPE